MENNQDTQASEVGRRTSGRIPAFALFCLATVAASVGLPLAANAAVDPSVGTAVSGGFTDLTGFLTTTLIPAVFTIAVIGIAVGLGLRWLRRGAKSS